MIVWLFAAPGQLCALSDDEEGSCLPAALGPWERLRSVSFDGIDDDERKAIGIIRQHGYCCFEVE